MDVGDRVAVVVRVLGCVGEAAVEVVVVGGGGSKLVEGDYIKIADHVLWCWRTAGKNWSFQGVSEANSCDFLPRVFPAKVEESAQGFPYLDNRSQAHQNSRFQVKLGAHRMYPLHPSTHITN